DLSQYTMAIDRQNQNLQPFFNPHHEAVFKLIEMSVEAIHKEGKWAGICGELGADLEVTGRLIEMGIDELSVSPGLLLKLRQKIREI
ncbi:MAG: phosphoenolpyruvate--protein phosphotransferase, partial [Butyrivibrio sp.]|nr:phosphoenolpyruvate--protein phosphotransferase [Butyrivibrio sp.]